MAGGCSLHSISVDIVSGASGLLPIGSACFGCGGDLDRRTGDHFPPAWSRQLGVALPATPTPGFGTPPFKKIKLLNNALPSTRSSPKCNVSR